MNSRRRLSRNDYLIGLAIAFAYVVWLLMTARTLGFSRDEGFYFNAASHYARWFTVLFESPSKAFERSVIDSAWAANHEHPSLMKSLFSLSWMFFHQKWHLFTDASTAYRFPGKVMMGVALFTTYLFGTRIYSRTAGIFAALMLGLMPRIFYHAHLACFDVPIMAMWTACIYVYWRATVEGGFGWAIASGVMYGLTLETKHNAWMLPAVFVVHAIVTGREGIAKEIKRGAVPVPASLLAMATIGPLVFLSLWPWLWNDTLPRLQEYVNFHVNHEYYNIEFLGKNYFGPPSPKGYMPFMILATVPTVTIVMCLVGLASRARVAIDRVRIALASLLKRPAMAEGAVVHEKDEGESDLLLFLSFAVPLSVFLLPRTPIFGGTKHWIPAYPFLCVSAGRGVAMVIDTMKSTIVPRIRSIHADKIVTAAVAVCVLAAPLLVTMHSHPFGLSSYVPLVGGTQGGADIGLNRQFWGFTTQSLAPYFAENAPKGASVYIMDTAWDSWVRMIDEKRLRPDLRGVGSPSEADISIVHHELHMGEVDDNIWVEYGHVNPDYVLTHDGVPIISVYKRTTPKRR